MSAKNVITAGPYDHGPTEVHFTEAFLGPCILEISRKLLPGKILDLGCGNGGITSVLAQLGARVVGCDADEAGIKAAQKRLPDVKFHVLGVYDDPALLGEQDFDLVISTEVIEHLFLPRALPRFARAVLKPGGHLVISTPYHGYLKNLLLSLANRWDSHITPFHDGGHIKFWSRRTLTRLLTEEGFEVTSFIGAGRIPHLWRCMILIARRK